jgi:hypothetical protein
VLGMERRNGSDESAFQNVERQRCHLSNLHFHFNGHPGQKISLSAAEGID